jgi:hypothetical protein
VEDQDKVFISCSKHVCLCIWLFSFSLELVPSVSEKETCLWAKEFFVDPRIAFWFASDVLTNWMALDKGSSSPVTGYTPGYKSPPSYMPQYRSQSPLQTYNSGRSSPQSVNLRPEWNSPNRRQQFSPIRGRYQSLNFRNPRIAFWFASDVLTNWMALDKVTGFFSITFMAASFSLHSRRNASVAMSSKASSSHFSYPSSTNTYTVL